MPKLPVIVVLGPSGLPAAIEIKRVLDARAEIWGLRTRLDDGQVDHLFADTMMTLKLLFDEGRSIIGVCSSGILIRAIASSLNAKDQEPPVLAVSEDKAVIVPLVGGHKGANSLANKLAEAFETKAAITTAGDTSLGIALDEPPECWSLSNSESYKAIAARLLHGEAVSLQLDGASEGAQWLHQSSIKFETSAKLKISETIEANDTSDEDALTFISRKVCIGVGCERETPEGELLALVRAKLHALGISEKAVAGVFSIDLKSDEPAVHALAQSLGCQARFFTAKVLEAKAAFLKTPSDIVFQETGCHGVAEGAAMAGAGANELFLEKIKGKRCTMALALTDQAQAPHQLTRGEKRGQLTLVGLGPGKQDWRTPAAQKALEAADEWVGFSMYVDQASADTHFSGTIHSFPIGDEEARCRHALNLAAQGKQVALICSGDPGIYAMSALVLQLVDQANDPAWRRIAFNFEPGITAMQGAVAKAGALMGHDFCAISLSNLMTPWEMIERRIAAASISDMVIGFYNPVSMRRRTQLHRAKQLLLESRPETTPVILGRNVGRPSETITTTTLEKLDPENVDMLTVVLVGAKLSRSIDLPGGDVWSYTPRGYATEKED